MSEIDPARRLMDLTIGYWASQAVYVAAKLGIADQLADGPLTEVDLAERTGTHLPSLTRLLRFLAELDVVAVDERGWRTTETGRLLRTRPQGSMRDLAVLYGEEFYAGWGNLLHTIRTGENAFAALHGDTMYPYFARRPELTQKFDRAMAAGTAFFEEIPRVYDFAGARSVVDVAGGNGALLATVLRANPQARGVLFDTATVIEVARAGLADSDIGSRVDYVSGDYYDKVPAGGDVYLLSRVLHGRGDDKCLDVLARVREAMPGDGALLIVERVIPSDGSPSLAAWFDMQMLAIAGGSERTDAEYRRLLELAGFRFAASHDLPLDTQLIVALPAAS